MQVANTLAYYDTAIITAVKSFIVLASGVNAVKLFTAVIYRHSMVIPSFCVIKLYYLSNYPGIAVNYHLKSLSTIGPRWQT
jgi:hypothetical protein